MCMYILGYRLQTSRRHIRSRRRAWPCASALALSSEILGPVSTFGALLSSGTGSDFLDFFAPCDGIENADSIKRSIKRLLSSTSGLSTSYLWLHYNIIKMVNLI